MNNEHSSQDFERLEPPLDTAVQAAMAGQLPEDVIERVKSQARRLAIAAAETPLPLPVSHKPGWRARRVVLAGLTVAAALLMVLAGVTLLLDRSAVRVFAQVIEKVKAANTVRLTMTTRFGRQPEIDGHLYVQGNRVRLEQANGMLIQVGDFDRKQALFLDAPRKLAQRTEINADLAREFANPIEQIRRAKSTDAKEIGQEVLNGRRTHLYRLRMEDRTGMWRNAEMTLWVDAESELPAKIVIRDPDPEAKMEISFAQFVWNGPLDARLFSLVIPEGFQPGTVMTVPPPSKPPEPGAVTPAFVDGVLRDRVPACIIWNPPGKTITAYMRDPGSIPLLKRRLNDLRQWDVATGKLRWSVGGFGSFWVAGSRDGKLLATVVDSELQVRDATSGKVMRKWATGEPPLPPLAFAPDGKTLAAGITEWGSPGGGRGKAYGGFQIWDVEQASLVRSIHDDKPVTFIKYSVDGKYLATSSTDARVKLWDAATAKLTRILPGHTHVDFSPDCKTIACVSAVPYDGIRTSGTVDLYDLRDGSLAKSFASEKGASASHLLWVVFSPDGRLLAATDWNGTVTIWDAATGERKKTISDSHAGALCAAFSPDGATLAIGRDDETLHLWKLPAEFIERASRKK